MSSDETFKESASDEIKECPICFDDLDLTDKSFKPCKCGYQVILLAGQFCVTNKSVTVRWCLRFDLNA
jgi:CCR4-NOT transcription complex subunit 4